MIEPSSIQELSNALRSRRSANCALEPVSLARLNSVVQHTPHDMTATVECGITLAEFQAQLARSNQWLPLDPPGADSLSIRELVDRDLSGPRRCGFGTVRDWVIGMKFILPDGRIAESGGKVVKNVAGYDLHKLMIGAGGELGIVAEVTFKVTPKPECELFLSIENSDVESAGRLLEGIWNGPTTPHVLDFHSIPSGMVFLVVGFCGTAEQVNWQQTQLDPSMPWTESTLSYNEELLTWAKDGTLKRTSVAPSALIDFLLNTENTTFVARAANGLVYEQSGHTHRSAFAPLDESVRSLFDPGNVFNAKAEVLK